MLDVKSLMSKLKSTLTAYMQASSFSSNVAITFTVKVISLVVGTATGIMVARMLGPAGKGSLALITSFPPLVLCFVHLGIAEANVYYLRKAEVKVGADIIRANTIAFSIIISCLTVLIVLGFQSSISASFLKDIPPAYFYAALLLIPLFIFETFGSSLLIAFERFKLLSSIDFGVRMLDTLALIIVLFVFHMGLWGVVLTFIFVYIVHCSALFLSGFWKKPIHPKPDFKAMRKTIGFGVKSHAQSLTGVLHYKIDIFILATLLSAKEVGYYSVAVGLASLVFFIPESVGHVLLPRLASSSDADAHRFTAQVCRNTLLITAAPALGIALFGKLGIRILYGAEFLPAFEALYLLIPGIMAMCVYRLLCRNFISRNRQQMILVAGITGLIVNVGLNFILIPRMGIAGAALASTISYSITSLLLLHFFLRESGYKVKDLILVKHSDFIQARELLSSLFTQKAKA